MDGGRDSGCGGRAGDHRDRRAAVVAGVPHEVGLAGSHERACPENGNTVVGKQSPRFWGIAEQGEARADSIFCLCRRWPVNLEGADQSVEQWLQQAGNVSRAVDPVEFDVHGELAGVHDSLCRHEDGGSQELPPVARRSRTRHADSEGRLHRREQRPGFRSRAEWWHYLVAEPVSVVSAWTAPQRHSGASEMPVRARADVVQQHVL